MWYYIINRISARIARRLTIWIIVAVFIALFCICPAVFGLADMTLRQAGLLPTYTPAPPITQTTLPHVTATRVDPTGLLRLRDVQEACQACNRFVLAKLPALHRVTFQDCPDAQFEVLPGAPVRLRIVLQLDMEAQQPGDAPTAARCQLRRTDREWQLEQMWFRRDGEWQFDRAGPDR
jgi:hypothetical protein